MVKNKVANFTLRLFLTLGMLTALPVTLIAFNTLKTDTSEADIPNPALETPTGTFYSLNVTGMPQDKIVSLNENIEEGITVRLYGNTAINLFKGDFKIIDANGADGKASMSIPYLDQNLDGVSTYSVWVRAREKPGGNFSTALCIDDPETLEMYCSVHQLLTIPKRADSNFTDVSDKLLFFYADLNSDGVNENYPIFDESLKDIYWDYSANGLKTTQLRLYQSS